MAVKQAASTKTGMTADQVTLLTLSDLQTSKDWRGVVAMEREAMTMAAAVRASIPGLAASLCGTLGIANKSLGDFPKAIEHHTQWLGIAQEMGDRAGEGKAYGNLGTCHMHLNEYVKAVAYFEAQHDMETSLKLAKVQSYAALNMGVALTLRVRAAGQGHVAGAQAPGPHSRSSASACPRPASAHTRCKCHVPVARATRGAI